jgi:uncharacterized protein
MSPRGGALVNSVTIAIIDSLEFARAGGRFEGDIAVSEMNRLADLTGDGSGSLQCSILGEQDREGQSYLVVQIGGQLRLRCQRCLELFDWPLRVTSRLFLVAPGATWPDDDLATDESDEIAAESAQPLLGLLEDEVILALPISPRHELCDLPVAAEEDAEASPFAALAKLKKF